MDQFIKDDSNSTEEINEMTKTENSSEQFTVQVPDALLKQIEDIRQKVEQGTADLEREYIQKIETLKATMTNTLNLLLTGFLSDKNVPEGYQLVEMTNNILIFTISDADNKSNEPDNNVEE